MPMNSSDVSYKIIKNIITKNTSYLNNIGNIDYISNKHIPKKINSTYEVLCDSLKLCCVIDNTRDINIEIKKHYSVLYYTFKNKDINIDISYIGLQKYNSYIHLKYKISMPYELDLDTCIIIIKNNLANIKEKIILESVDIFTDISNITTRSLVKEFLDKNNINYIKLADKESKVGKNCISYYIKTNINQDEILLRVKLYNKFVQMIESTYVSQDIGCQLANFVYNKSPKFLKTLLLNKYSGMTRIEITIYHSKILLFEEYISIFKSQMFNLYKCPVYKLSFEDHWKKIVDCLSNTFAIYIKPTNTFALFYWWNSITHKICGVIKDVYDERVALNHLANFSYNERPIHYFIFENEQNTNSIENLTHQIYKRTTKDITMVPGSRKSLYPYKKEGVLSFKDVGFVDYKDIKLGWPEKRTNNNSSPIVNIKIVNDNLINKMQNLAVANRSLCLPQIGIIKPSEYKAAYYICDINNIYEVKKYGYSMFRNKEYMFINTKCGVKVRCENNLRNDIEKYINVKSPILFKINKKTKIQGNRLVYIDVFVPVE